MAKQTTKQTVAEYIKQFGVRSQRKPKKIKKIYNIFVNPRSTYYDTISITGEDDEDCLQQLNAYLDTKQDCYGIENED